MPAPAVIDRTYQIPEYALPGLQDKVTKLNQKVLKLGLEPLRLDVLGSKDEEDAQGFIHKTYEVKFVGKPPKLQGWEFVATLTHAPEGNIVRKIPGKTIPNHYLTAKPCCDHCKKDWIARRDTYIVKNDKGIYQQVGSSCLADFLHYADPYSYAAVADEMAYLPDQLGNIEAKGHMGEGGQGPGFYRVNTEKFLATTAAVVDKFGWLSRGDAYNKGGVSTADRVIDEMTGRSRDVQVTQAHKDEAKKALAMVQAVQPQNDYQHNLTTIAKASAFTLKEGAGFAASMLPYYRREIERQVARQHQAVIGKGSNFVGEIGERLYDIPVTVLSIKESEGSFGPSDIVRFLDEKGNVYVWFAVSGKTSQQFEVGKPFVISGTVKNHKEWQGNKETILSRVVIEEIR